MFLTAVLLAVTVGPLAAQGNADPLGTFGMDRLMNPDARQRAMGWAGTAAGTGAGALFSNPALLTGLTSFEARVGGQALFTTTSQRQEWYPDKVYATLSLIFEKRLEGIVDTALKPLERAYDDIGPNWDRSTSRLLPTSAVAAVPFEIAGLKVVAAAGFSEMIDLDHYYQNNNALNPHIGAFRPAPIIRPALGETLKVAWFQYLRERTGTVYGITPGLAVAITENLSVGAAATVLTGTSDDKEKTVGRGRLRLTTSPTGSFNVYFIDSVSYRYENTGTSEYSGLLPQASFAYKNENFAIGATFHLPGTVTRTWDVTSGRDTMGVLSGSTSSGEDKVALPLSYTVGLAFYPKGGWTVGVDYVVNRRLEAAITPAGGAEQHPWLNGREFRLGLEYVVTDGLLVRMGYREDVQVFPSEGAAIQDDPVRGSVYSAGVGIDLTLFRIDAAYEYRQLDYHDMWTSNVNYNDVDTHAFTVELSVQL
jgi:hypothetical protein